MSQLPRRRGRPPAYDRDTAIAALLGAFWDQGFAATSLDDLSAAAAMNRPSLYAAFGDKKAMYLAAIERYRRDAEVELGGTLDASAEIDVAIRTLLRTGVDFYLAGDAGPRGCLAVCTAATEALLAADVRDGLAAMLATLDGLIAARLSAAVAGGQLPADFDIAGRAMLAGAVMHSLAVRARAGATRTALLSLADVGAAAVLA